jgi:hypothetical protein
VRNDYETEKQARALNGLEETLKKMLLIKTKLKEQMSLPYT